MARLPQTKWHEVIGEPTFADAILDRIVHNAPMIELARPSMRKLNAGNINPGTIDLEHGK
jgi:DNA replication protein DnaC